MDLLLNTLKPIALMTLRLLIVVTCVCYFSVSMGQDSSFKLKVEQLGGKYIYTLGDMCSVFPMSFSSATPFSNDNLAIVSDSLYYIINLKGEKVSPYFQDVIRHKSGLYIGKESERSGYAIYDVEFIKMTSQPFDTIFEHKENILKCISRSHVTYITTSGVALVDIEMPSGWAKCQQWYPNYIFSYKELQSLNIRGEIYDYTIFRFGNTNGGKYEVAYCDYRGNILVNYKNYKKADKELKKLKKTTLIPLYRKFWEEKKNALDNCENILANNVKKASELYPTHFDVPTLASIASQQQVRNKKGKVIQKAGKFFVKSGTNERISEVFNNILPLGNKYYLVKNYNNKYAIANMCGGMISDFVYDDFLLWSNTLNPIYRYSISGKKGLKVLPQNDILPCEFDDIGNLTNEFAIAIEKVNDKNKYFVINKEGSFITTYTYDNFIKEEDGTYKAFLGEGDNALCAILDPITGKEKSPTIQEQFFNQIVDVEMEPNEMIETYDLLIEMGGPVTAAAYNNKGVAYEELDDIAKARECYEKAKNLGNETASENIKRLDEEEAAEAEKRRQRAEQAQQERERNRQENLNTVVDLLGSLADLFGGNTSQSSTTESSSYTNYDTTDSYNSGSSSSKIRANDKCSKCLGSGKCTSIHAKSKLYCSGSGKCNYCNGTGVLHISTRANDSCPNCEKRGNGKCKTCHGTGKCQSCNGTGLKR